MVEETLQRLGYPPLVCAQLVRGVTEVPETHLPIQRLKDQICRAGLGIPGDAFERGILISAARETAPRIESLPVYESVKSLLHKEFQFYTDPVKNLDSSLTIGTYGFVRACKTISLRRFPSGPMDWEISGFPRSWLLKVQRSSLPRVLGFLLFQTHGFAPMFFTHVARRPKNLFLVMEREVLRAYYRMARSLELQPIIKGILSSSWLHDPAAVKRYPYLSWLSRPYLETNGLITTAGPAPADSGFAEGNVGRQEQFAEGEPRFQIGVALWPRRAAIEWAYKHPELAG
jgi:hypothetical protein